MLRLLLAVTLLAAPPALAADATKPHPHTGVVEAYTGRPDKPELTAEDLATLAEGKPVTKQSRGDSGGRGIAVQDIHADPATIWSKITDYPNYPTYVGEVKEADIYEKSGDHIKARFVLAAMMMNVEYFIDHVYKPDQSYMTWTLDYTRESDLDDSVGFWIVEPLADKPGWSRVFYSVDVRIGGWIPAMVENMIARQGLTQATGWVKRESEKAAGNSQ